MGEQKFWIEDSDFYTEIASKITDLTLNSYLLVTDLQNDITFVPKKTADFLGWRKIGITISTMKC